MLCCLIHGTTRARLGQPAGNGRPKNQRRNKAWVMKEPQKTGRRSARAIVNLPHRPSGISVSQRASTTPPVGSSFADAAARRPHHSSVDSSSSACRLRVLPAKETNSIRRFYSFARSLSVVGRMSSRSRLVKVCTACNVEGNQWTRLCVFEKAARGFVVWRARSPRRR